MTHDAQRTTSKKVAVKTATEEVGLVYFIHVKSFRTD